MKTEPKRRTMPMWPTYLARLVAFGIFAGAPVLLMPLPLIRNTEHPLAFSLGISACLAILVGTPLMNAFEWLVNAHFDSVERKSRFDFGTMLLTAGILVVGVATFILQWQKSAG